MRMCRLSKVFMFIAIGLMTSISSAYAISGGKNGQPTPIDGELWQNIFIEDAKYKATALMPGSPSVMMENSTMRIKSIYKDVYYFMSTQMLADEKPPKNYEALVKALGKLKGKVNPLPCKKAHVVFALEYSYTSEDGTPGITRVYVTKHKMYLVGALGKNLSLYESFCDKFTIVKDEG